MKGLDMSYARLMAKSDECLLKAIEYYGKDWELCQFYRNASKGYRERALRIKIC